MSRRFSVHQVVQKLLGETRSVTAVEFALIGPVLFFFLFCIVLLGIAQFWQLTLDDAVRNATRQVAIGAANAGSGVHNSADFVTAVCSEFGQAAPNCSGALQFAVQGAPTFTGSAGITPATLNAAGQLSPGATFSGVTAGEPVLVQAVYPLPIAIPLVPMSLVTLNGTPSIVAAAALGAEP
jgi:Flp pilus assembly protein TadG